MGFIYVKMSDKIFFTSKESAQNKYEKPLWTCRWEPQQ